MAIANKKIAETLDHTAMLLEIRGANAFRVRAYSNAARLVESFSQPVFKMIEAGKDLSEFSGIGKDLAGKIKEVAETGKFPLLNELEKEIPSELTEITKIRGLGPKKAAKLYAELKIKSIHDLEEAVKGGELEKIKGFGKKTQKKIQKKIKTYNRGSKQNRVLWLEAHFAAQNLIKYLKSVEGVDKVTFAGSYRRTKTTVGDLDVLVECKNNTTVIKKFTQYENVKEVVSQGDAKATVVLESDLQVDVRVIPAKSYGAALQYFTGSKAHGIAIRKRAQGMGYKINEYGVYKRKRKVGGEKEEEIYEKLKLQFIPPELREDSGEIEAAEKNRLPNLVKLEDIKGDLHAHTNATDGKNSLEEMANAARELGRCYLAITDHTKHLTVAKGLKAKDLRKQIEEIDKLNSKWEDFRLLKSAEVDILADGKLDLDDEVLQELDLVVAAIHSQFDQSKSKMTKRIHKAMDNPNFNILAHPTARLLQKRKSINIDLEEILHAAKARGCFVEINAQPARLDLEGRYLKLAKEIGVKVAISTDSHSTESLKNIFLGVNQARRGWLDAMDVINTRYWRDLKKLLKRS
jgi:DNA polymerase (family X)